MKRVYTDLAVVDVTPAGFVVREMLEGLTRAELRERTGAPLTFAPDCRTLAPRRCRIRTRSIRPMDFIEVNGVGLRYELSGSGERTVVLIHEMGGALESWDEVVPRLARRPARAALRHARRRAVGEGARHALHRHHGG